MESLGAISKNTDESWKAEKSFKLKNHSSASMETLLTQWHQRALKALNKKSSDSCVFYSCQLALSKKEVSEVRQKCIAILSDIIEEHQQSSTPEKVYHLNFEFFNI